MKVFLSAFRLLSKVKAAKLTSRTWCLSSKIPTGKYEKTDRANEIYKSELGLPIIPTGTERRINPQILEYKKVKVYTNPFSTVCQFSKYNPYQ